MIIFSPLLCVFVCVCVYGFFCRLGARFLAKVAAAPFLSFLDKVYTGDHSTKYIIIFIIIVTPI